MTPLAVGLVAEDARPLAPHVAAISSLPKRFRLAWTAQDLAGSPEVDVVLLGPDVPPDSLARAADQCRAVMLHRPSSDLLTAAQRAGAPTVCAPLPLIDHPGWRSGRECFREAAPVLVRACSLIGGRDGTAADLIDEAGPAPREAAEVAVIDLCSVVLDLFPSAEVERAVPLREGVDALLRADGLPISLTVSRLEGGASERRFEVLGTSASAVVNFPSPALFGAPCALTRTDPSGSISFPPLHENGWRSAWRNLHDQLAAGASGDSSAAVERALRAISLADAVRSAASW